MCLTLADGAGGKKGISIHGIPGLALFLAATQRFMYRPDLTINIQEILVPRTIPCKECVVHCLPLIISGGHLKATSSVSYICETPSKAGRMDMSKALALGVPKGPLLAKLKNGECVEISNGIVVAPGDVLDPSEPGRSAAIICAMDISELGASSPAAVFLDGGMDTQSQASSSAELDKVIESYLDSEVWSR